MESLKNLFIISTKHQCQWVSLLHSQGDVEHLRILDENDKTMAVIVGSGWQRGDDSAWPGALRMGCSPYPTKGIHPQSLS